MFGRVDKSKGFLFSTYDLSGVLQNAAQQMRQEVESLEANRLLNTAPEDLKNYLVQKYRVEPIALCRDQWYADHQETQVDVRYDQSRWIRDTCQRRSKSDPLHRGVAEANLTHPGRFRAAGAGCSGP
jgi:hypothetical protein